MQNLKLNKYAKYFSNNNGQINPLISKENTKYSSNQNLGSINTNFTNSNKNNLNKIPSGREKSRNELINIKKDLKNSTNKIYEDLDEINKEENLQNIDSSLISYGGKDENLLKSQNSEKSEKFFKNEINKNIPQPNISKNLQNSQSTQNYQKNENNLEIIFEQETQRTETFSNSKKSKNSPYKEYYQISENNILNISNSSQHLLNPQYPYDYLIDIYSNLLLEENIQKNISGYMNTQNDINEKMRAILIDWIIDVHYKFKLTPETLFLTVNLIDKYLSLQIVKRDLLQLIGVSALLIACKYEEIYSPELRDFEYITDKAYKKEEIVKLEIEMLKLFNFEITVPSSFRFYEIITTRLHFTKSDFNLGRYFLEAFLIDYRYLKYQPSQIACSAAFLVMNMNKERNEKNVNKACFRLKEFLNMKGTEEFNFNFQEDYAKTMNLCHKYENILKDCCKDIMFIVENLENTQLLSVKKKFMSSEFCRVAKLVKIIK
jgi:cyclin B